MKMEQEITANRRRCIRRSEFNRAVIHDVSRPSLCKICDTWISLDLADLTEYIHATYFEDIFEGIRAMRGDNSPGKRKGTRHRC
jgi:hypothetical protein